jgi:hypothetical protein
VHEGGSIVAEECEVGYLLPLHHGSGEVLRERMLVAKGALIICRAEGNVKPLDPLPKN